MKIQKKINDTTFIEGVGETHTEIFSNIASLQEVFGNDTCGKCGCKDIRFVVREVPDPDPKSKKIYKYFEMHCQARNCRARLSFGQHTEGGTLFPKRKDGDDYLPDNGWLRYDKDSGKHI